MVLFALVFGVVGLGLVLGGLSGGAWFLSLFGLPFAAVGGYLLFQKAARFDGPTRQARVDGKQVAFSQVHAVQLLKERVTGDKRTYLSFELNLVLKDGQRLSVTDHADLNAVRADAGKLQVLLGCKLWDAT